MSTDSHDKMIAAFQEYFKWQDRFYHRNSDEAGIKARNALSIIRDMASLRRKEIQALRKERKKLRRGKDGRPFRDTYK
jgi:hypothetical protein